MKKLLKEVAIGIVLLLAASGITLWAYLGGQAFEAKRIDAYFQEHCGEVPRYMRVGRGLDSIYVETKLKSDTCDTGEEIVIWMIPHAKEE